MQPYTLTSHLKLILSLTLTTQHEPWWRKRSAVSRGREDVTQLTMRELDYAGVAGVGAAWGGDAATSPPVPRRAGKPYPAGLAIHSAYFFSD